MSDRQSNPLDLLASSADHSADNAVSRGEGYDVIEPGDAAGRPLLDPSATAQPAVADPPSEEHRAGPGHTAAAHHAAGMYPVDPRRGHATGHGLTGHGTAEPAGGHEHQHLPPFRRLLLLLRPEMGDIWVVAVFSAVVGVLALATPVAVEALVNTIAFGRLIQPLAILSLILLVFLAFGATIRAMQAYIAEVIQRRLFVRVVADLATRIPRVRIDALDQAHGPELLNRFFDVMTVQKSAALLVLDGVSILLQAVIGMAVLAFYHPYLLGFDLFLMAAIAVVVFVMGRGAIDTSIRESYAKYAVASWLEQVAEFCAVFKLDGGYRALRRADELTTEYVRARRFHFRIVMRQIVSALAMQAVAATLLLGLGGWLVMNGQLTLGQLVAAELIIAVIVGAVAKLGKHMEGLYDLLAAVDKLGHLFDLPVEREDGEPAPRAKRGATVRLCHIDYAYPADGSVTRVLNDFSVEIVGGELIAVQGPPGSGKSTLLELVGAFREPLGGYVEFDGVDLRSLNLTALREQIAIVHSIDIFAGTVAENIRLGRDDYSSHAVRSALEAVDLWDDLMRCPRGLDTLLQNGGTPLSETQGLRLMFVRALVRKPRLLLIDGALDRLPDPLADRLMTVLRELSPHTTVVVVTGREAIAQRCDRRLVLPHPAPER